MPFYVRKAKKLGPLRINLSKSGVGASVGVKGARVAVGPRGTIVNMGRGGVYYRKSLGRATPSRPNPALVGEPTIPSEESVVESADVDELTDSSSGEFIAELNGPRGNWLQRLLGLGPPIELQYDLDATASENFRSLQAAILALMKARSVWLVEAMTVHGTTMEQKYNAGAGSSLKRRRVGVGRLATKNIRTNAEIFGINTGTQHLLFFPDRLLIQQRGKYAAVAYPDITLAWEGIRFVESDPVPSDAEVLEYTWQYVNKGGGPDRRFSNNRQLPVVNYEAIRLTSAGGINLALEVSNRAAAEECCSLLSSAIERMRDSGVRVEPTVDNRPAASSAAMAILSERPPGWEYSYFSQLLSGEIDSSRAQLQAPGLGNRPESISLAPDEFPPWLSKQIASLTAMLERMAGLLKNELPVAFGPEGLPGDPGKIEYVASQLGDAYRYALRWPPMCKSIRTDPRWSSVLREIAPFTSTVQDELQELASRLEGELPDILRRGQAGETVNLEIALVLSPIDMGPFERELDNARRAFDSTEHAISSQQPSHGSLRGGTGKFGLEVVGESFYLPALRQVRRRARPTPDGPVIDVVMRLEPNNPKDADAVRVMSADDNALLGYLSHERAKQYKPVLMQCDEASLVVTCTAVMRAGVEDKPNIGIWLDLAFPAQLKSLLKDRLNVGQV